VWQVSIERTNEKQDAKRSQIQIVPKMFWCDRSQLREPMKNKTPKGLKSKLFQKCSGVAGLN